MNSLSSETGAASSVDGITLHRDPHTDEWVFDLSPGIDLLEVMHVLAAVQQHALSLLQKQLCTPPAVGNANAVSASLMGGSGNPIVANAFAQL